MGSSGLDEQHRRWAEERPSRIFEVAEGRTYWTTADLIGGDGSELSCSAIRATLEALRVGTSYWPIPNRPAALRLFDGTDAQAPHMLLALHCADGHFILRGTGKPDDPDWMRLSAGDLRDVLRVEGRTIISLGCNSGDPEVVRVFLDAGASAYVAPTGAPFGHVPHVLVGMVFLGLVQELPLAEAVERCRRFHPELAMWRVFQ